MDSKDITPDMHEDFYRYIGGTFDKPRYNFMYKTDAPVDIRALFYVPDYKPSTYCKVGNIRRGFIFALFAIF